MIALVISSDKTFRKETIQKLLSKQTGSLIVYDDTYGSVTQLEQFIHPSLFDTEMPTVHAQYLLSDEGVIEAAFIQKLLASPTLFLFEEFELPKTVVTLFKKNGALIHQKEVPKSSPPKKDVFKIIGNILVGDKKSRWLAYHEALREYPVEALMGMLYWKIRTLTTTTRSAQRDVYRDMYKALLRAHTKAWQEGSSLERALERVLLEH